MSKFVLLLILCTSLVASSYAQRGSFFVNPTGTYLLKGEKHKNEIRGNYGEIRVKLLNDSLIALAMYGNAGYPQYSSATFMDTIAYVNNRAFYTSRFDSSCQIVFSFEEDGLNIKQIYTDPASTCGFEKGSIPLGFISKYSSNIPIIQLMNRGTADSR